MFAQTVTAYETKEKKLSVPETPEIKVKTFKIQTKISKFKFEISVIEFPKSNSNRR